MPTLMQRGATWLGEKIHVAAGRTVSIRQGSFVHSGLTASATMQEYEIADGEGFLTRVISYDWLFVAADLPSGFSFRDGDVIAEGDDRYEVSPLGNKPCVEDLDTSGILVKVHSKKLTTDA